MRARYARKYSTGDRQALRRPRHDQRTIRAARRFVCPPPLERAGHPISLYARAQTDSYLLVIANQTDQSTRFVIAPCTELSILHATERFGNRELPMVDGNIVVDLEAWGYQLLDVGAFR